ncbi:MAG: hypothetical protein IPN78_11260 [Candidatus Accumulibacter sp.]|nr:hypothetical protein [Candidatus Accumulibacter propinquus]
MITMLAVSAKLTINPLAATCASSGAWATFCSAICCGAGSALPARWPKTCRVSGGALAMPISRTRPIAA